MKKIVIKKTGKVDVDFSCENIIRFTSKLYKYREGSVITTPDFIIARIPDKMGDMAGAQRFFEKVDICILHPPKCKSFEEMKEISKKAYNADIEVGHSLILQTVKELLGSRDYNIFDE